MLEFFIDASFATHLDRIGITVLIIFVLMGLAIVSFSKRQKIAMHDSTESAEMVAFSDMLVKVEWWVMNF
jgi:hypothetical protein